MYRLIEKKGGFETFITENTYKCLPKDHKKFYERVPEEDLDEDLDDADLPDDLDDLDIGEDVDPEDEGNEWD